MASEFLKAFGQTLKEVATAKTSSQGREPIKRKNQIESVFGNKRYVHRDKIFRTLKKTPFRVPGYGRLGNKEAEDIFQKTFPPKSGNLYMSKRSHKKLVKDIEREARTTGDIRERKKLRAFGKILRELGPEEVDLTSRNVDSKVSSEEKRKSIPITNSYVSNFFKQFKR